MTREKDRRKKRGFVDLRYVSTERRRFNIVACIVFMSVVTFLFFQRFVISGSIVTERSMLPTLPEGTYFLVNRYIYRFVRPQRGDIVVLRPHPFETDQYVKRVVALEGETLMIRSGKVYINNELLEEPYALGYTTPEVGPVLIEKDHYFALGDNRPESIDSRHFGAIPLKKIVGKIKSGQWFTFR